MKFTYLFTVIILFTLGACTGGYPAKNTEKYTRDSAAVMRYIHTGNDIYAQKSGYDAFVKSMDYYDSAWQIAQKINDRLLLGVSYFAKGRAYDAWNKEPQKTIQYYKLAAEYYQNIPAKYQRSLYLKHLVAHSYDKIKDSINCVGVLKELYHTILPMPDSVKKKLQFTAEMALISTEVKNYTLADEILTQLTKREWIKNDSDTYDYLNHFYLTKSRMDIYGNHKTQTAYLDSLEMVFKASKNLSDSIYFSDELQQLYFFTGNLTKHQYYENAYREAYYVMNNPINIAKSQKKLDGIESAALEREMKLTKERLLTRKYISWALVIVALIISTLLFFLYKRNKEIQKRKTELDVINVSLHQKNIQNEILNKEIHHRVKNNLQMIMSLVYMQERNTDTVEVKENMQNIRLRIESIANLHKQLMEQADEVDLRKYVQHLVANVTKLTGDEKKTITHLEIQQLTIPQKISFPLGLIINEWITNSVKYAKPGDAALEIAIEIFNGNKEIHVRYKDNGMPQAIKPGKKTLGLEIVNLLVTQLNAKNETDPDNLFKYKLTIPLQYGE